MKYNTDEENKNFSYNNFTYFKYIFSLFIYTLHYSIFYDIYFTNENSNFKASD